MLALLLMFMLSRGTEDHEGPVSPTDGLDQPERQTEQSASSIWYNAPEPPFDGWNQDFELRRGQDFPWELRRFLQSDYGDYEVREIRLYSRPLDKTALDLATNLQESLRRQGREGAERLQQDGFHWRHVLRVGAAAVGQVVTESTKELAQHLWAVLTIGKQGCPLRYVKIEWSADDGNALTNSGAAFVRVVVVDTLPTLEQMLRRDLTKGGVQGTLWDSSHSILKEVTIAPVIMAMQDEACKGYKLGQHNCQHLVETVWNLVCTVPNKPVPMRSLAGQLAGPWIDNVLQRQRH